MLADLVPTVRAFHPSARESVNHTNMDDHIIHPVFAPPSPRSPRTACEALQSPVHHGFPRLDVDDSDDSDAQGTDDAIPPRRAVAHGRSHSLSSQQSTRPSSYEEPAASSSPAERCPVESLDTVTPSHGFSFPFNTLAPSSEPAPPNHERRRSRGLNSYRINKKTPLHLHRQPSLDTIASVTTTASSHYHDPPEAEAPCPDLFTLQHGDQQEIPATTPTLTDTTFRISSTKTPPLNPLSPQSSSASSRQSPAPAGTPLESTNQFHQPPQSLFRKMLPRRKEESPRLPARLVIAREVTINHTSDPAELTFHHANPTTSTPQHPPPVSGSISVERSTSQSSWEWSASAFDTRTLTEAELSRCKKKGINPALYAEMRAAKRGKWSSPIAGNSFF